MNLNLPWVTRYAVSSCINVRGNPKNPFCWATPGSVPALKPEILCTQWSVAAAVGKVVSFSIESERTGMILCASQTVATPFTR